MRDPVRRYSAGAAHRLRCCGRARLPTPAEVLALRPSAALQARIETLLAKNRADGLDPAEQREWEGYEYLEHLVRLAKANALVKSRPADAP